MPVRCPAFGKKHRGLDLEGWGWPRENRHQRMISSQYRLFFRGILRYHCMIADARGNSCAASEAVLNTGVSGHVTDVRPARFPPDPPFQKTQAWQKKEKISQKKNRVRSPSILGKLRRTLKGRARQAPKESPLAQPAVIPTRPCPSRLRRHRSAKSRRDPCRSLGQLRWSMP